MMMMEMGEMKLECFEVEINQSNKIEINRKSINMVEVDMQIDPLNEDDCRKMRRGIQHNKVDDVRE